MHLSRPRPSREGKANDFLSMTNALTLALSRRETGTDSLPAPKKLITIEK